MSRNGVRNQIDDQEKIINAFLKSGTISDPAKSYHLEFVCDSTDEANELKDCMAGYGIEPGIMMRKEHCVVYLKDSESIADMLVILGAQNAMLVFENAAIMKEMKENVQRRVNCETANIKKTVSASVRQLDDIELIKKKKLYADLPEGLKEAAELRIQYPDASLNELAGLIQGTGKSGLNHRFRKLARIAEELRTGEKP